MKFGKLPAALGLALIAAGCGSPADLGAPENLPKSPCDEVSSVDLASHEPGDLVRSSALDPGSDDVSFPAGAEAWRILYVSTGNSNSDLQLVCGVVVAPQDTAKIDAAGAEEGQGRMVTWSHGTIGLQARCQPSMTPEANIWGAMPGGINQVAWGKEGKPNGRKGDPADGALQYMIDNGWVVAATDYYADLEGGSGLEPYVVGKIEAANTIDSARAAHQLLVKEADGYDVDSYEYMTWGHSQGGHSAAWAAQLAEPYSEATDSQSSPRLELRGAALLAPATTIVVDAEAQPYTANHHGLADWIAHQKLGPTVFGDELGLLPLGPSLFSFILGSWTQVSEGEPAKPGEMPAFPPKADNLSLDSIATDRAVGTIEDVKKLCLEDEPLKVLKATAQYDVEDFLVPELGNGPRIDGQVHGNMDVVCSGEPDEQVAKWCDWMKYQAPGPLGTSDLPKIPRNGDELAPVYIADGTNDLIIRCATSTKLSEQVDVVPNAKDCLSLAFYDAMAEGAYCPEGEDPAGYLKLDLWQQNDSTTAAGHFEVPGLAAARSLEEPVFEGSPLESFMRDAFDQKLNPQCVKPKLMNPSSNTSGAQR
ncbi:MAG: lipase family protein [Microthrixaceae bacterium]